MGLNSTPVKNPSACKLPASHKYELPVTLQYIDGIMKPIKAFNKFGHLKLKMLAF